MSRLVNNQFVRPRQLPLDTVAAPADPLAKKRGDWKWPLWMRRLARKVLFGGRI